MDCRILALDMDGTLLTSDKLITPATLDALKRARDAGVVVALSTGRGLIELEDYKEELNGVVAYGALISGGLVYDFEHGAPVEVRPLDEDLAADILHQCSVEDAMGHLLLTERSVCRRRDVDDMDAFHMLVYQPMYRRYVTYEDDLAGYARAHASELVKVNLYHKTVPARERTRRAFENRAVQIALVEETSCEFTALGVTKAAGLRRICEEVGCTLEQCVAVGDAANDLEVFEAAGLAVAMGNATREAREAADVMVASNDDNGIVEVVDRIVLGNW